MTCFSSLISSNSLVALYPFPFIPTYAFFPSILNFSTLPQAYQDYPCLFAFIPIVPSAWNALSSWLILIFPSITSQRQWCSGGFSTLPGKASVSPFCPNISIAIPGRAGTAWLCNVSCLSHLHQLDRSRCTYYKYEIQTWHCYWMRFVCPMHSKPTAEMPGFTAENRFIHEVAKWWHGRATLKSISLRGRDLGYLWYKESGLPEVWKAWRKVIGDEKRIR